MMATTRTIDDIKEEIEFTKETLKNGKLKASDKKAFEEALDELEKELKEAEKGEGESKAEAKETKEAIQSEIDELEGLIDDKDTDADEKKLYEKQLTKLKEQLGKIKPEPKTAAKKEPEKKATAKKSPAPAKKPTEKKAAPAKSEGKEPAKKEEFFHVVDGKKYDANDCKQLIEAFHARIKQRDKTGKKYKSKSPAEKAGANIKTAVRQITDGISDKKIEDNPKQVIKALREFNKKLTEGFSALEPVLKNKSYLTKLKQSLKGIDEVIAEIEKEG